MGNPVSTTIAFLCLIGRPINVWLGVPTDSTLGMCFAAQTFSHHTRRRSRAGCPLAAGAPTAGRIPAVRRDRRMVGISIPPVAMGPRDPTHSPGRGEIADSDSIVPNVFGQIRKFEAFRTYVQRQTVV